MIKKTALLCFSLSFQGPIYASQTRKNQQQIITYWWRECRLNMNFIKDIATIILKYNTKTFENLGSLETDQPILFYDHMGSNYIIFGLRSKEGISLRSYNIDQAKWGKPQLLNFTSIRDMKILPDSAGAYCLLFRFDYVIRCLTYKPDTPIDESCCQDLEFEQTYNFWTNTSGNLILYAKKNSKREFFYCTVTEKGISTQMLDVSLDDFDGVICCNFVGPSSYTILLERIGIYAYKYEVRYYDGTQLIKCYDLEDMFPEFYCDFFDVANKVRYLGSCVLCLSEDRKQYQIFDFEKNKSSITHDATKFNWENPVFNPLSDRHFLVQDFGFNNSNYRGTVGLYDVVKKDEKLCIEPHRTDDNKLIIEGSFTRTILGGLLLILNSACGFSLYRIHV